MNTAMTLQNIESCFTTLKNGEIYRFVIDTTEKTLIEKALERSAGNQVVASKILGINRNTLRTKIRRFNINTGKFR